MVCRRGCGWLWATLAVAMTAGAVCAVGAQTSGAQRSVRDGVYTTQQAQRGASVYARECAECHGATLKEDDGAAPLAGSAFVSVWTPYSVGDLYERMRKTMPKATPGSLGAQEYADILAQILLANGYPAGKTELTARMELLNQIRFD